MHKITLLLALLFSGISSQAKTTVSYSYDNLNRVTQASYSNGTQIQYTYDALGNRTQDIRTVPSYVISLSANPTVGGNLTGAGTYQNGQTCTLSATTNSGYTFSNWTENGVVVSTNPSYSFTISKNRNLVANYTTTGSSNFSISISANPTIGGSVSGGGTFTNGQTCNLSATANSGYTFSNWTENGIIVSTSPSYSFSVSGNRTIVANFTTSGANTYSIITNALPSAGGTISGAGSYTNRQACSVVATSNSGYSFTNWTENGTIVSTAVNYNFVVSGNRNLTANFNTLPPNTYTITTSNIPTNGGTSTGGGTYTNGQSCTISAAVNNGYTFLNWSENGNVVSSNISYTFTVNSNRNFTANYSQNLPNTYTISGASIPSNGGNVAGYGAYTSNQNCTLSVTSNLGYVFLYWLENGNIISTSSTLSFSVLSNRTINPVFKPVYQIVLSTNQSSYGTVTGAGIYDSNTVVNISATPNANYEFLYWTENGIIVSNQSYYTFNINTNRNLLAVFRTMYRDTFTVTTSPNYVGGGNLSGAGHYLTDDSCYIAATVNTGYTFKHWAEGANVITTNPQFSFVVLGNRAFIAVFDSASSNPQSYTINVSSNPSNGGIYTGNGSCNSGSICNLKATPNSNYQFLNWTEGANIVSTNMQYSFNVSKNRNLIANFKLIGSSVVSSSLKSIIVYPNPVNEVLNIEGIIEESVITIRNILGQMVFIKNIHLEKNKIDISAFTKGVYLVEIRTKNDIMLIEKIVVE